MRNFVDTLKLLFVFCGAVLGAGLLSGSELVSFFNSKSVICLLLSGLLFFIGFAFIGAAQDGFTKVAFLIADGVFASAMLSGLDEIAWKAGILYGFPVVSLLSILVFHFLLSGNIGKLERVNCVLMPVSVVIVLAAAIISAPISAPQVNTGAKDIVNAVLYACMNLFVALPSARIASESKGKGALITAAFLFAVFFIMLAYLILRVSPKMSFPLFSVTYGTPLYPVLIIAIFIGSFTSLICYLYPLNNVITGKWKNKKSRNLYCFLLYAALFALSRAGIAAIIKYVYPFIGALGLFVILKSFVGIKGKAKGDTMKKRSALCQERKRPKSKNLPKKNTAII